MYDIYELDDVVLWVGVTILENDDLDVLVVHFVGVDYVGYEYGMVGNDGSYVKCLCEIDDVIKELVVAVFKNMVVMVMVDHGMMD